MPGRFLQARMLATCIAVLAAGCASRESTGGSKQHLSGNTEAELHVGSPQGAAIDVGNVTTNETDSRTLVLVNDGADEAVVDRFVSTCECTSIKGLPVLIPPYGRINVEVFSDWSSDPLFKGGLAIEIEFFSGKRSKGMLSVRANVAPPMVIHNDAERTDSPVLALGADSVRRLSAPQFVLISNNSFF